MPREKDLEIGLLLDFYGEMLSPEKREAVRLYYDEDLSLAEISRGYRHHASGRARPH